MDYTTFNLPTGLKDFFDEIIGIATNRFGVTITFAEMRPSGYLKVRADIGDAQACKEFNMLMHSYGKRACVICRVCGKRGRHRKKEPNKPSLCKAHYLPYLNEVGFTWLEFKEKHGIVKGSKNDKGTDSIIHP